MAFTLLLLLLLAASPAAVVLGAGAASSCDPSELQTLMAPCGDQREALKARSECCEGLRGDRDECLCVGMDKLWSARVPLLPEACEDYASCPAGSSSRRSSSGTGAGAGCSQPSDATVGKCGDVARALFLQRNCFCHLDILYRVSRPKSDPCLAEALTQLGIRNADALDKLCRYGF